jgi:uncharacterized phage infection (PIP) family protein YhgE
MTRNDFGDMANLLVSKLQILETKVDALNQDRVTRSDFENLRKDISNSYVPRDTYEARHTALIERDSQLEAQIRDLRKDCETDAKELRGDIEKDQQRVHERLESGKQQIEDRIKQQSEIQLSTKDRFWLRVSQWVGVAGLVAAVLDWIFQHIKFQ